MRILIRIRIRIRLLITSTYTHTAGALAGNYPAACTYTRTCTLRIPTLQVLPPVTVLQRYVMSYLAFDRSSINSLWIPPKMHIGEMYANTVKTIAMGLMYGPLFPPCYMLTFIAMVTSYISTKVVHICSIYV